MYYDHRQTVDIYGKPRKGLILEATQFYPDSAQLAAGMGDDVLWVGDTYGLGALRGWDGSRSLQLDSVRWRTQRVVAEGPLRAIVEVEDLGYVPAPGLKPVNMVIRYTLYAGHRDVDVDVTFDRDVSAYRLPRGLSTSRTPPSTPTTKVLGAAMAPTGPRARMTASTSRRPWGWESTCLETIWTANFPPIRMTTRWW